MYLDVLPIKKEELTILLQDEAQKEGWLFSEYDIDFCLNYPGNKLFAIKINNELAGCILIHTNLNKYVERSIYSAGLFIILRQYRGQRIVGSHLWHHVITATINEDSVICFNAVAGAVRFYERLNYAQTPLVNTAYTAQIHHIELNQFEPMLPMISNGTLKEVKDLQEVNIYNKTLFSHRGDGFCNFILHWLKRDDAICMGYYENGKIQGYGVITICNKHYKEEGKHIFYRLAPLYANTVAIANSILIGLVYCARQNNAQQIELSSLEDTPFSLFLENLGFIAASKDVVMCNSKYAHKVTKDNPILKYIFASIPLEYPHEIATTL